MLDVAFLKICHDTFFYWIWRNLISFYFYNSKKLFWNCFILYFIEIIAFAFLNFTFLNFFVVGPSSPYYRQARGGRSLALPPRHAPFEQRTTLSHPHPSRCDHETHTWYQMWVRLVDYSNYRVVCQPWTHLVDCSSLPSENLALS